MAFVQKLMSEASGKSCLLLLFCLLLVMSTTASYEDSSSLEDMSSSSLQDLSKRSGGNGNPFLRLFNGLPPEDKRALSLFAHWKPQYGFKPDFPAINTRSDIVTRGGSHTRPLGQPLRWG